jgi:hypothetical protein
MANEDIFKTIIEESVKVATTIIKVPFTYLCMIPHFIIYIVLGVMFLYSVILLFKIKELLKYL